MGRPKKNQAELEVKKENKIGKPGKSSLLDKILANSNSDMASLIDESSFFNDIDFITTDIPILNIAFSGRVDGGFYGGLHQICGPSKHFKSSLGLVCMKAHQNKYLEGINIFVDSEGGVTSDYLKSFKIDTNRVVHDFVTDIEELKHKVIPQLDGLVKGDPVMFFIDSIGNLSSKREYQNALDGNTAADMTRAKELKSFTRLINGKLKIKNIPCIAINHSYQTLEMFSKAVVGGGTGMTYSSDNIWIIGRNQEKDAKTKEIIGYNFTITIDKSRFVKEKSKFNICVRYDGGIEKYSGLAEIAEELGVISECSIDSIKGKPAGYEFKDLQVLKDKVNIDEKFWNRVFKESEFNNLVEMKYRLGKTPQTMKVIEEDLENDSEEN